MHSLGRLILAALALTGFAAVASAAEPSAPQWWQRGQDSWYTKDDWKGLYLTGEKSYKTSITLAGAPAAAYAYVWSGEPYVFKVNGQEVGADCDTGTIEDYDLAPLLKAGENTLEIISDGEVIAEGAAVLADGKEIGFATDASWGGPATKTSKDRRTGPSGYMGDTHMARIVIVTAEQKAKAAVNAVKVACRRIAERDLYNFWKSRDPREVLTVSQHRPSPRDIKEIQENGAQEATRLKLQAGPPSVMTPEPEVLFLVTRQVTQALDFARAAAYSLSKGNYAEAEKLATTGSGITKHVDEILAAPRQPELARGTLVPGAIATHNASAWNRLGWVASAEPLDNDPAYWEFDISPPGAPSIALAGWWKFTLDPDDAGVKAGYAKADFADAGWSSLYAPTKWGWERWGYTQYNKNVKGWNKPYNGLAWYRKTVTLPADWKDQDLVLRLGLRWGNVDWLAVNGEFVSPLDKPGSNADMITIPARLVKAGQKNTLALRVLNADNIGGIINPGLRLSPAGKEPRVARHIVGPGAARETVFDMAGGPVTQMAYSSALSPAAVVASSGKAIRLGGWVARGFDVPARATFAGENGPIDIQITHADEGAAGPTRPFSREPSASAPTALDPAAMRENWLLFWTPTPGEAVPRPLLVVFEKRPEAVAFVDDGFGGRAVELRFAQAGARIVLLRPFSRHAGDELAKDELARVRLWSRALLKIPVEYLEELSPEGNSWEAHMAYGYLDLADDWHTRPLALAPLPMLFSYALENHWPGARAAGNEKDVLDLGCRAAGLYYIRSDCGTYRVLPEKTEVGYVFERREPRVYFAGCGTLGEEARLGDPMYEQMQKWGFNVIRPQVGIPAAADYLRASGVPALDAILDSSKKHNLTCFVNWFTDQEVPDARRKDFIGRWVALAEHCRDLPENLVVYDFINEPAGIRWDDYNAFMKEVTLAVRAVDKRHWLSVEFGGGWAQPEDADMTEPTADASTIYQFHAYGPHTGDCHRFDLWYPRAKVDEERFESYEGWEERMLSPVRFMIRTGREVMHGELGLSCLGPDDAPRAWLDDVLAIDEKYRMHWCWWNYSGTDIHRTGLVAGKRVSPLLETLEKYAKMKPPEAKRRPAATEKPKNGDKNGGQ